MHPIKLYQPVLQKVVVAEESAEVIVPDSFPDILRIVDSWGMACLKAVSYTHLDVYKRQV